MTSLFAKRVLIALARKLSFDSICFYRRARNLYFLMMTNHRNQSSYNSVLWVRDKSTNKLQPLDLANTNWVQALKSLEGKVLYLYSTKSPTSAVPYETIIDIDSIEALVIDLELNGYLNKIQTYADKIHIAVHRQYWQSASNRRLCV